MSSRRDDVMPSRAGFEFEFLSDASVFLDACGDVLAEHPVLSTVVSATATAAVEASRIGVRHPEWMWYLIVREDGDGSILGLGMRTAPNDPSLAYLLPMPDDAARAAARAVHARGDGITSVNGALGSTAAFAEELARLNGLAPRITMHSRLFEAAEIEPARAVPGRLRSARADEGELYGGWHDAFLRDADEQAGRPPSPVHGMTGEEVERRIRADRVWFWVDDDDVPVHVSGVSLPSFGVTRLGPVYTPKEHRGHGYASAAVAQLSQRILDRGLRPCLFTDQANPTSNAIYARLGYRPVVDMVSRTLR